VSKLLSAWILARGLSDSSLLTQRESLIRGGYDLAPFSNDTCTVVLTHREHSVQRTLTAVSDATLAPVAHAHQAVGASGMLRGHGGRSVTGWNHIPNTVYVPATAWCFWRLVSSPNPRWPKSKGAAVRFLSRSDGVAPLRQARLSGRSVPTEGRVLAPTPLLRWRQDDCYRPSESRCLGLRAVRKRRIPCRLFRLRMASCSTPPRAPW